MQMIFRLVKRVSVVFYTVLLFYTIPVISQTTKVKELEQKLKQTLPDSARMKLLQKLATAYSSVNPEKKFYYALKYKDLAERLGQDSIVAEAYLDMGVSYGIRSKLDSALYYFSVGYDKSKAINYPKGIARSLACSGFAYDRLDNKQGAVNNYLRALHIYKTLNFTRGINQCLANIGSIYFDLGQYKLAKSYFNEVLKSYTAVKDELGIAYASFGLGNAAKRLGDKKGAHDYYEKSLLIREKFGDLNGIALARWGLATLEIEQQQYDKALADLEIALKHNLTLKNVYQQSAVLLSMADAYIGKKQYKMAEKFAVKALGNSSTIDSKIMISEALESLTDIYTYQNNIPEAFKYQTQYIATIDSIRSEKTVNDVTLMEFGRIRSENNDLVKNNEQISIKNSGYLKAILIISGLLLLVVALLVVLYRRNLEKQATNKLLQSQAAEIASNNHKLAALNEEITTQMEITAEQNMELEKLNAIKNKFFSIVSHDLRSPLATLKMLFSLYRDDQIGETELRELLARLEETIYSTSAFLDNLLEWSKSQLDGMSVKPSDFSPGSLIAENLRLMDSQIKLKELKIENLASEADTAYADPNMADVVIRNLLSNCVKFCNPGDSIVLELIKKEEKVLLSIRDTGPGISQKDLDKLFSLEHTTSTGTSGEKGHHLGLILCKDMIEQNNGKIWVESTVGVGTVFWIEFPASEK